MGRKRILGAVLGAAAGAVAAGVVAERRVVQVRRTIGRDADRLGSLHSAPRTVTADDGTLLHAEIDEVAPYADGPARPGEPTLVFVHGYALSLDCWHFQRAGLRGKHRMAFYDQRAHGQSGTGEWKQATIDQLGRDLAAVLEQLVPQGPVVLVGHSMGGMSILAFAEQFPKVFSQRVAGVALLATAASDLHPHDTVAKWVPDGIGQAVTMRVISALAKAPELVDSARRLGSNVGYMVVKRYAFGSGEVDPEHVEFLDELLAGTSMEVLGAFFPQLANLDKAAVLDAFDQVPTLVVGGTEDRLTPVERSRAIAETIDSAELLECRDAGHLLIFECADKVNEALDGLVERAMAGAELRPAR
ncbi:alpha/beta hydrolase [Alteromonas gracilis]